MKRISLCLLLVVGCTKITRQNPYDPQAPDTFKAPATIAGTIRVEGRSDASEALVSVVGTRSYTSPANVDGTYSIGGVLPGTYKVTATLPGFRSTTANVQVKAGDSLTADELLLSEARGTLRGQIVSTGNAAAESLGGALINAIESTVARAGTPRSVSALSNLDGTFTLRDVPLGAYRIAVSRTDLAPVCVSGVSLATDGDSLELDPIAVSRADALLRVIDATGSALRYSNTRDITVELNSIGATGMRLAESSEDLAALPFSVVSATQTFQLAADEGPHTLHAQLLDGCGQTSKEFTTTVTLDRIAPTGAVAIAEGADFLRNSDGAAAIAITAADASPIEKMKITFDGSAPETAQPFMGAMVVPLGAGEGPKTVRAILIDAAGNESVELTDTITKDSLAPVLGVPPLTIAERQGLFIRLTAHPTLGDTPATVAMSNFPTTAQGPFTPFSTDLPWLMAPGGDGPRTVFVRFADAAGNMTQEYFVDVTVDQSPPESPVVVVENGAAATHLTSNVELDLSVIDPDAGTQMRLSNCPTFCTGGGCNACCHTRDYAAYASTVSDWTFVGCSEGDATVYVQFRDASGNESTIVSDTVKLDTTPPTITSFVLAPSGASGASAIDTPSVLAAITASDGAAQPTTMALANLPSLVANCSLLDFSAVPTQPYAPFVTHLLQGGDGLKAVCVQVRDAAGNVSVSPALPCAAATGSCDDIFLDTVAPDAPTLAQGNARTPNPTFVVSVTNALNDQAPSSGGTHYEVRGGQYLNWTTATPPFSFALAGNQQNILSVRTVDAAGNASPSADLVVVHDDRPPRPPFIFNGAGKRGTLTFSWLQSPDADVDHYLVRYGNFPGVYTGAFASEGLSPVTVPAAATSARLTQAPDQSTVYVAVAAVDETGLIGDDSNEFAIGVYDASPKVAGFVGGTVYATTMHDGYLFNRTALGIEAYALADPSKRVAAAFSPIVEIGQTPSTAPRGRMARIGDLFLLVQQDRLELVQFASGGFSPKGVIRFPANRYTNAVASTVGAVTYAYLTGEDRIAIYDISVPSSPVFVGANDDVDTTNLPSWFHPHEVFVVEHDFGSGMRRFLFTTSNAIAAIDVTNPAAPSLVHQVQAGFQPLKTAAVTGTRVIYFAGKMMNGQNWIEAKDFDGNTFSDVCQSGPVACSLGGTGCGGVFSQCDYFGRDFSGPQPPQSMAISPDGTTLLVASGWGDDQNVESFTFNGSAPPTELGERLLVGAGGTTVMAASENTLVLTSSTSQSLLLTDPALTPLDSASLLSGSFLETNTQAITASDGRLLVALHTGPDAGTHRAAIATIDMSRADRPEILRTQTGRLNSSKFSDVYMTGSVAVIADEQAGTLATFSLTAPTLHTPASTPINSQYGAPFVADGGLIYATGTDNFVRNLGVFALDSRSPASLARIATCTPTRGDSGAARELALSSVEDGVYLINTDGDGSNLDRCRYVFTPPATHDCVCAQATRFNLPFTTDRARMVVRPPYLYYFDGQSLVVSHYSETQVGPVVGALPLGATPLRLLEAAPYLIALTSKGVVAVDISSPAQMKQASTFAEGLRCRAAAVDNQRFYCATDGVVAYDLPTSDAPTLAGAIAEVDQAAAFTTRAGAVVRGNYDNVVRSYALENLNAPAPYATSAAMHSGGTLLAHHPNAPLMFRYGVGSDRLRVFDTAHAPTLVEQQEALLGPYPPSLSAALTDSGAQLFAIYEQNQFAYWNLPFGSFDPTPTFAALGPGLGGDSTDRARTATTLGSRLYVGATMYTVPGYGNPGPGLVVYDLPGVTEASRQRFGGAFDPAEPDGLDAGLCTTGLVPCVVYGDAIDKYSGNISLIEAPVAGAPIRHALLRYASPTWIPALYFVSAQQLSLDSHMYLSGLNGFSIWSIDDTWTASQQGMVAGSHGAFYLDETAHRAVVAGVDSVTIVDVTNPAAPTVTRTLAYPSLGMARQITRRADRVYVSFGSLVRMLDIDTDDDLFFGEASDYDTVVDVGGHGDPLAGGIQAAEQKYYSASQAFGGAVSHVTAFAPKDIGGPGLPQNFKTLPFHQYAPRSGMTAIETKSDRLYVCRKPNPDEGNITFEILAAGLPSARPTVFSTLANVPCDALAISGQRAWLVESSPGASIVRVYDLANEAAPLLLGQLALPVTVSRIVAMGRYAYLGAGADGVIGLELSATLLQRFTLPAPPGSDLLGLGQGANRLFLSFFERPLAIYDLTDPGAPEPRAALNGIAGRVDLSGFLGFVTPPVGATRVVDLR